MIDSLFMEIGGYGFMYNGCCLCMTTCKYFTTFEGGNVSIKSLSLWSLDKKDCNETNQ